MKGPLIILSILAPMVGLDGCTGATVEPAGRPCSADEPCGPGTVCDPVTETCLPPSARDASTSDIPDTGATDTQSPDKQASVDKGPLDDGTPVLDKGPIADKGLPDLSLPCGGVTCPLGCNVTANRCYRLKPSNFSASTFFDKVTQKLQVTSSGDAVINTDTGQITIGGTVVRASGKKGVVDNGIFWFTVSQGSGYPELSIFGMTSLDVSSGATVKVVGTRSLALYLTGGAAFGGIVAATPAYPTPASGGFAGGDNALDALTCFGGGGKGGDTSATSGGAGGGVNGSAALTPLYGGCGGGGGAGPMQGAKGGGGGGAIQISANGAVTVSASGVITMPGGGGEGGDGGGGGGGGSGGAILVEGTSVTINGKLVANGGGGGCGGTGTKDGQNGDSSTTGNAVGCKSPTWGGSGGHGGFTTYEGGQPGESHDDNGGGGGGAAGRIRLNSPSTSCGSSNASPTPSKSSSIAKW